MTQSNTNPTKNEDAFHTSSTVNWDCLIYTLCYRDKDNLVNGFAPTYCIESWGKSNTVMLMEMFKDYSYSIQCREHDYHPDTNNN